MLAFRNCWILSLVVGIAFCCLLSLATASPFGSNAADTLDYMPNPKRSMDMDTNGFYGDTFNSGFGGFETTKRNTHHDQVVQDMLREQAIPIHRRIPIHKRIPYIVHRKRMDMGLNGFHGDTFSSGFGDFGTTKRKRMQSSSNGFYGDTFSDGFGDFATTKKRNSGMNGFHGDTFSQGFGDFTTV
jgi:hypothetical protein